MAKQKQTGTEQVNEYMQQLEHPLKAEVEALRSIILNATSKLAERVKWNSPSFYLASDPKKDLSAFNLREQKHVHMVLVFYNGAMIHESNGLLKGDYKDRRMAYFESMEDIDNKKETLEKVVREWVALHE